MLYLQTCTRTATHYKYQIPTREYRQSLGTRYTITGTLYLEEIRPNTFPTGELEHPAQCSDQNKPGPENMQVSPKVSVLVKDKSGPRNRRARPCLSFGW